MQRSPRSTVTSVLAALALAACQAQPVLLTDPDEILAAAAATAASASSVHIDLALEGTITIDPLGTGAGAPIDLEGTTLGADLDLQGGRTRATFAAPALLGLAGEVIVADAVYLKSTLTGPRYSSTPLNGPSGSPFEGLAALLARTDLRPTKGPDVPCPGGTCYTLMIALGPADLAGLGLDLPPPTGLPIPIPEVSVAAVDLTLHVEQRTTRLADATATIGGGGAGELSVQATFTRWNETLRIDPPPADQVEPAG